jgi:hypothetical protein
MNRLGTAQTNRVAYTSLQTLQFGTPSGMRSAGGVIVIAVPLPSSGVPTRDTCNWFLPTYVSPCRRVLGRHSPNRNRFYL